MGKAIAEQLRTQLKEKASSWNSDLEPGPTAQTVKKMKQDNILKLYNKGDLSQDELWAAEMIRGMFEKISKGFLPSAIDHSEPYRDKPTRLPRKGLETLSESDLRHWEQVYVPWSMDEARVKVTPNLRRTELVHFLVVENQSANSCEIMYSFAHGRALEHLQDSLQLYCVCAGRY